jgi:carbamoylphosphate synthase large subunit
MNNILISNWGISSELIIKEAEKIWYNIKILSKNDNLFIVDNWEKKVYFKSVDCWLNTAFWLKIANNKELTYILANENNIRVPKSIYLNKSDFNQDFLEKLDIDFPVITKPITEHIEIELL